MGRLGPNSMVGHTVLSSGVTITGGTAASFGCSPKSCNAKPQSQFARELPEPLGLLVLLPTTASLLVFVTFSTLGASGTGPCKYTSKIGSGSANSTCQKLFGFYTNSDLPVKVCTSTGKAGVVRPNPS